MDFELDKGKAAANLHKHGVDFEDAIGMFEGPVLEARSDRTDEQRCNTIGEVNGVVLAVIYTVREENRRIISARRASKHEREAYRTAQSG